MKQIITIILINLVILFNSPIVHSRMPVEVTEPKQLCIKLNTESHPTPLDKINKEVFYVNEWCTRNNGQAEQQLTDGTRCDCLTDDRAIEFDFITKWYESIGQSLHYAIQTGKNPGIVFIVPTEEQELKYIPRILDVITKYNLPIKFWIYRLY